MNFSKISNRTLVGRLLRLPLRLIPPQSQFRIRSGPAKGLKWIVGTSDHGTWLGTYEFEKQQRFAELLSPGDVVFDLGAHAGFYTILASKRVGSMGHVFAFEPFPRNCEIVQKHVSINGLTNVTIVESAVADHEGTAHFAEGASTTTGSLADSGGVEVKVTSLDAFAKRLPIKHQSPTLLKIDVEGAEMQVLRGAENLLRQTHPCILLGTHSLMLHRECREFLENLGYQLQELEAPNADGLGEFAARKL